MIPAPIIFRYDQMLISHPIVCEPDPGTSLPHLRWMLQQIYMGHLPFDKQQRWLGFIQGILIAKGLTTVPVEREWTRPYLNEGFPP
ncbi:hypothetical protein IZ6_24720 [Terrihabitans soli]|uniref:Uncharacterized protein n=1 Tax=Terrihabitans soli TaxID=708113 RepID=A0A6S6QUZ4_9HYPH|nr:hypothetical protein [Terrihabitans soli]BCJ91737.1 hypothetical protein IZ6_24720 [Terrihabitans soli]